MNLGLASLLTLQVAFGATERVLDDFQFADAATARRQWVAAEGTPPVQVVHVDGSTVLRMEGPFADNPQLARTTIDRQRPLDLSVLSTFALEIKPEAACGGQVSLYFHSGRGWYAGGASLSGAKWQTLVFSKQMFRTEEQPAGWDQIDGMRISVWKGEARNNTFLLRRLVALRHETAVIVPDGKEGEGRTAYDTAERMTALLAELGITCDSLTESAVAKGELGDRRLAILPYNPTLEGPACQALTRFVERGGKLFVCYVLPAPLQAVLGIRQGEYARETQPGDFASIHFDAPGIAGLPASVRQASWNIHAAEPGGFNARVLGRWFDAAEKPTGKSALVLSDRGAFFSHIVLSDDAAGKTKMLAAVLGHLQPSLWTEIGQAALAGAEQIGHCSSAEELRTLIHGAKDPQAEENLKLAQRQLDQARERLAASDGPGAVAAAHQARRLRVEAYLKVQPSPSVEGRAFWEHSGTGAYPGDWDRTARELAAAGFNMIIPNMLWGGRAHYASDVLPRSETFEKWGDQIAQCQAAAKQHGLEVHVWKVNYNLSGATREFIERMRREGRTQVDVRGQPTEWLEPAHPDNFRLELDSLLEVVRKYDVAGIHFDYIRYPNGENSFSDFSRKQFEADSGRRVEKWPQDCYSGPRRDEYRTWRCAQITRLVEAVHQEAKKIRPQVKISAAVFGAYPSCRESVAQDWPLWIQRGYLDFVCPMDYTESDEQFMALIKSQRELVAGRIPIYPGIGATASRIALSPDRVVGQIALTRQLTGQGFTIFNLSAGTAREILPAVGAGAGKRPAVPPHR